jgi:starch phosphorylase
VPLVGVGLWYPEGYFHQRVADDGRQEAIYLRLSPLDVAMTLVRDEHGNEVRVKVNLLGRDVTIRAWRIQVGRVPVYLLDTDIPENEPVDRALLARLYGGDQRTRVAQEIVLGIGGVRMLRALGIKPTTWHMNEGHSAFMVLERCRELIEQGLTFDQAREVVTAGTVFTVHTPVPAGNDAFPFDLIAQFFSGYWGSLGLSQQQFFDLARHDHGWGPVFSMPALALRFSSRRNGVSELHGETSRRIWNDLWPEVPTDEVPIGHVTNGVHAPTWVSPQIEALCDEVLPEDWRARREDAQMWQAFLDVDDAKFWRARQAIKTESVNFLRRRVLAQKTRHGASPSALRDTGHLFDPNALTIGFARRFATYKRATLIFRDLDRLARLLDQPDRPVQLVFAGKAHPADKPGQELIAQIHNLSKDPRFAGKVLFIEDYDMAVGRALTRGVDVWLNNPRRPNEASGTSGQKAGMNGVLNLSILDGWWPEGFDGENGWAIGGPITHEDDEVGDAADADALYELLEREVVPLYYERDERGIPKRWVARAKRAVATLTPAFNARRMVKDYVDRYYAPVSEQAEAMAADGYALALKLASRRRHLQSHWQSLYLSAKAAQDGLYHIGDELEVEVVLNGRDIDLADLKVELVYSRESDALNHNLHRVAMSCQERYPDGGCLYKVRFKPAISGRLVYGVRVYPVASELPSPFDLGLIRWA